MHQDVGYFCGVFAHSNAVQVAFEFGVLLPDPHGVLSGSGAQVRYVVLVPGEPVARSCARGTVAGGGCAACGCGGPLEHSENCAGLSVAQTHALASTLTPKGAHRESLPADSV